MFWFYLKVLNTFECKTDEDLSTRWERIYRDMEMA